MCTSMVKEYLGWKAVGIHGVGIDRQVNGVGVSGIDVGVCQ